MQDLQQHISALERQVGDQAASPLFARLAALYLEAGRAKDALRICDAGLAHFPFYSTAHLVKGKALLQLNLSHEARREFEFVHDWLPTNPTVASLLESIPTSDGEMLDQTGAAESKLSHENATEAPDAPMPPTDEQASSGGGDFFGAIMAETAPKNAVETTPETARDHPPAESENVFGLPSEAPASGASTQSEESPDTTFGTMEGFGGSSASSDVTTEPAFSGADAGMPLEVSGGESYHTFAERMRGELGPTGITTIEEYLLSPESTTNQTTDQTTDQTDEQFAALAAEYMTPLPASDVTDAEAFSPDAEAAISQPEPVGGDAVSDLTGFEQPVETPGEPVGLVPAEDDGFSGPEFSGMSAFGGSQNEETVSDDGASDGPSLFEGPPPGIPEPVAGGNKIEEFAEKLQDAKKLTPIIDFSSKVSSSSPSTADETAAGAGFVTPTLAEIYAKQGWYDDAINAYKTLAKTRPAEKDKFEQRVKELEEEKAKAG